MDIVERLLSPAEWRRSDRNFRIYVADDAPKEAAGVIRQLRAEINALQDIYDVHLAIMQRLRKEGYEI